MQLITNRLSIFWLPNLTNKNFKIFLQECLQNTEENNQN